jgi:hypothetical protein
MTQTSPAVYFTNPGLLDSRLIVTFGANVKADASAIGTFGTGLKYSIATIVRNGGSITVQSGLEVHTFAVDQSVIRGKSFDFITMTTTQANNPANPRVQTLAFTTELGKNWKPWMVYRELWSNCKDESGQVSTTKSSSSSSVDCTIITIRWPELFIAHNERHKFLLRQSVQPIYADDSLELYDTANVSPGVYYRGILVTEANPDLAVSKFTYNILSSQTLTEDRTLSLDSALSTIALHIARNCTNSAMIEAVCNTRRIDENAIERSIPFDSYYWAFSDLFKITISAIAKDKTKSLSMRSMRALSKLAPIKLHPDTIRLSDMPSTHQQMWAKASSAVLAMGYQWDNIQFAAELQNNALGKYFRQSKAIFISQSAFRAGTKQLVMTLLEECIHAQCGAYDFSREFQEALLVIAVDQYEQRIGSPL